MQHVVEDEGRDAQGGGVLAGLLAPLRLPERAIRALEGLTDLSDDLRAISTEMRLIREQTEPLAELLPAIESLERNLGSHLESVHENVEALESEESYLNKAVKDLVTELRDMHKTLHDLRDDVERVTDRLPDPDEKTGPFKAARDVLTGNSD